MSYVNKLMQMKQLVGKKERAEEKKPSYVKPAAPAYAKAWELSGLRQISNEYGVLFERKVIYPYETKHGKYRLNEFFDVLNLWNQASFDHPYKIHLGEKLLFFDTETTGLKGTGTQIFLLGLLRDTGEHFELTQYVLADPSNEVALLYESKFWDSSFTVVSYNGKSFDWPQLEMRWTLNREFLPPLKEVRQIDLLHSTKRIWRDDMESMKLTKLEREKLGVERKNDIPGHLAPIIYYDAVKSGNAESLMKVLIHNEWDLLSLITLYIHLSKMLLDGQIDSSISTTNIGKWYGDLKNIAKGKETLQKVAELYGEEAGANAQYYLGKYYKKEGQFELAIQSFRLAVNHIDWRKAEDTYKELAIIYEQKLKNFEMAYEMTELGMHQLKDKISRSSCLKRWDEWEIRKQRLENKIISRASAKSDKI